MGGRARHRELLLVTALMVGLTVGMTWPQAARLSTQVNDRGDPLLNAWALAWVAHQFPRDPLHLFDANIFYPERGTLAYSESLVLPGLLVAPLRWVGVHPIATYNLVMLAGFAGSGIAMFVLIRHVTGSAGAAVISAVAFAFLPYRFDHYPQVQLQQAMWMPLALWSLHRMLDTNRIRHGLACGAAVACQAWSCLYYAIFFAPYLVLVGTVLGSGTVRAAGIAATRRRVAALAAGALLAIVLTAPLVPAYTAGRAVVGERTKEDVGGAYLHDYVAAPPSNRLYGAHTARFGGAERYLFPGFATAVLAIVGLWPPWSPTRVAYAAGLLFAFDVSRGLNGISYGYLYDWVPPFRAVRAASRMGLLTGMTLAILAGLGAASLLNRLRRRSPAAGGTADAPPSVSGDPARQWLVAAAVAVLLVESTSAPLSLQRVPRNPPEVSRWLGTQPPAAVLELPLGAHDTLLMYYSIWHWQRLANGYSGFFPRSYTELVHRLEGFPDDASMDAVRSRGISVIVVHENLMRGDATYRRITDALARRSDVRPVATFGSRGTEARAYAVAAK